MNAASDQPRNSSAAVVGGGLAGLAAAAALCRRGLRVELFEGRKRLGGRAGSFHDRQTGRPVDFCQHVSMGCCTNLADFCRRIQAADCFRRDRKLHFFSPEGNRSDVKSCAWLPAPLHLAPGLMRLRYLTLSERWGIVRTMQRLARERLRDNETVGTWLRQQGATQRTIERFWSPVLVGALSETVDRASLAAAQKVFVDGFLASRRAYELEVPQVPLDEVFNRRAAAWLRRHDVTVHLSWRVLRIDGDASRATGIVLGDGTRREFDFVVVAVPWHRVRGLFPDAMLAALPELAGVENMRPAPITAVHLWLDRPIMRLPHAVLVGKTSQWVFGPGKEATRGLSQFSWNENGTVPLCTPASPEAGHYYQVVISASHALAGRDRKDILAEVQEDLRSIWPDTHDARLLHWRVVRQPAAVFSARPDVDRLRPAQRTQIENLALAGDWTATGWPATMEGAVRSGHLAAEAVLTRLGSNDPVLVPDLPRGGVVRIFSPH